MKKKLWSIVSIALLFVGVICFLKANAEEGQVLTGMYGNTVTWEFNTATGAMTISGTGFFSPDPIWEQIDKSQVTSLTIEEGVSSFVRYAFRNCTNLSYVVIPKGFTSIPECAFEGCSSLSSIALPEGLNDIGHSAFMGCGNLSSIDIPESVTYIDAYAFYNCSSLNAVSIPEGVTSIGDYTFWNCDNLNTVSIPESVTIIGAFVFEGCDKLKSIDLPNRLISIGNYAFRNCMSVTSIQISESVTSIGNGAFSGCSSLTGIWVDENNANYSSDASGVLFNRDKTEFVCVPPAISGEYVIPETITAIEWNTFINCYKLSSVVIPANVTTISPYFGNSLTGIWVEENNANYSSDSRGVLFNKDKTTLIYAPGAISGQYEVPQSVTTIASSAFAYCKELSEVIIPKGVTDIGGYSFEGCSNLTSIVLPEGITIIPDYAFIDCSSLSSVVLPNSLTEIRTAAFSGCMKLSSIVIPDNVTLIGNGAFIYCNLSKVTIPASVKTIGIAAFSDNPDFSEIRFEGDAPAISSTAFVGEAKPVTATVYYPAMNETWNAETKLNYGGDLTWVPYYDVLEEGDLAWNNLEGGDISISICAPYEEFIGVQIDGNELTDNQYSVTEGENGTVVTVYEEYLISLDEKNVKQTKMRSLLLTESNKQNHSIVVIFENGTATVDLLLEFTEEPEYIPGDINNDGIVNNRDLTRLFQYLSYWEVEVNEAALDVNGDGSVNNRDLTRLFQYLSNWDVEIH